MKDVQTSTKKIVIAGYYGHSNAGDEAILSGILAELRALNLDLEFTVISGDPDNTTELHKVHAIGWKDFQDMIREVSSAALVIVGGGGLIQDYWGVDKTSFLTLRQGGMSEYGSPIILARLMGVPSMFYAVGVGPLSTDEGCDHTRTLFEAVDAATVRDEKSRKLIEEIGIRVKDIPVVPDPAIFAPEVDLPTEFLSKIADYHRPLIAVSLRYWEIGIESGEWHSQISDALDQLLETMGGSVLFMPFHISDYYLENDRIVCRQIQARMAHKDRTELLLLDLNPLQRFSAMSKFDFVIGMRLHAIVAALRAGLPCVGIEYDPKVRAFMDQMSAGGYCVDLTHLDSVELAEKALTAYQNSSVFKLIGVEIDGIHSSISKSAQLAKELLGRPRITSQFPPMLVNFAIQQTLNLAQSEQEKVRLNDLFRKVWEVRSDPDFIHEHDRTDLSWIEKRLSLDQDRLAQLETENLNLRSRAEAAEISRDQFRQRVQESEGELTHERELRHELEAKLTQVQRERWDLKEQLSRIEESRGFRTLMVFWKTLWRIRDPKHAMIEFRSGLSAKGTHFGEKTKGWRNRVFKVFSWVLPSSLRHLRFISEVHHLDLKDRSTVVLYTNDERLFPDYRPRVKIEDVGKNPVKVTLVTTVKNEAKNAQRWVENLEHQKRIPDEIILLEGGSIDETFEIIEAYAQRSSLPIRLLSKPGTNIATRRNLGVTLASHPIIAMTDFGCTLKEDWLEKMMVPFMADPETEVVAGGYTAQADGRMGESAKFELIPETGKMDPQAFLPACRSIAFKKSAWEAVGGFPEWLTKTGEDTYFDLQLKQKCKHWGFVPDAQVVWHAPETLKDIWDKLSSWTVGDGESGAFVGRYMEMVRSTFWSIFFSLIGLAVVIGSFWISPILGVVLTIVWVLVQMVSFWTGVRKGEGWVQGVWRSLGRVARVHGFLRGVRNRARAMARRYAHIQGVLLFLTGVPIDDTGGGARGTQIALELLRRGYLVIFVHKYLKQESVELNLDYDHPDLLHFTLSEFDWKAMRWELRDLLKNKQLMAFLEFPFKEFLPIVRDVERMGGKIIYDLIDEWKTSLGGDWYSEQVEKAILNRSHVLIASAPSLVKRLEQASGREVLWIPNAVNLRLFNRHQSYDAPQDLPGGSPKIIYIGALWGEWFDWELLQEIAQAFPSGALAVIGDYRGQCPFEEPNLHFLGLKPQTSLPAYLQHSDVAIIPWKIGEITQATSPLKIFEYLAMETPVVAPKLSPLEGIPYVFLSQDHDSFIENIKRASDCVMEAPVLDAFLRENSWQARLDQMAQRIPQFRESEKLVEERQGKVNVG